MVFIAGLRHDSVVAPCVLDGRINGTSFAAWVEHFLIPTPEPGAIVVIDNLGSHERRRVRKLLKAVGIRLFFLRKLPAPFGRSVRAMISWSPSGGSSAEIHQRQA